MFWASPVAQLVKNLPGMWETWVQSLGWEDTLEKGMAAHSSILAWSIPSMGSQKVGHNWVTFTFTFIECLLQLNMLSVSGCCSKIDSIMTYFMYCIRWRCAILIWLFADGINLQTGTHTPGPSFPQCYIIKSFVAFLVFLFIFVILDLGWRSLTFLISRQ